MIPAYLIRQAKALLDAIPDNDNPVIEVKFNDDKKVIEVWNMLADHEMLIASVVYYD